MHLVEQDVGGFFVNGPSVAPEVNGITARGKNYARFPG
jgi:hypothetical protein